VKCHYLDAAIGRELYAIYESILGKLVNMILHPEYWTIGRQGDRETRRQGEGETRRQGDKETRRGGDKGTRGQGDKETRGVSPKRLALREWEAFLFFSQLSTLNSQLVSPKRFASREREARDKETSLFLSQAAGCGVWTSNGLRISACEL
jgi:hypothetical protein